MYLPPASSATPQYPSASFSGWATALPELPDPWRLRVYKPLHVLLLLSCLAPECLNQQVQSGLGPSPSRASIN